MNWPLARGHQCYSATMEYRRLTGCKECLSALRPAKTLASPRFAAPIQHQPGRRTITARAHNERLQATRNPAAPATRQHEVKILESLWGAARSAHTISSHDLNALHNRVFELSNSVLRPEDSKVPKEQRVLCVLEQLEALAKCLIDGQTVESTATAKEAHETATSALLGSVNARSYPAFISKASILNLISEKAEEVLRHPNVFITPAILSSYVSLQCLLHQPSSFPAVFELYASKPIPQESGDGVKYVEASPDKINAAVPSKTANAALTSAINAHNLQLAIDIIDTTFCKSAFKKNKVLRQAFVPLAGLGVAPVAAYTVSAQFSMLQNSMDPSTATGVAFAGIMTYIGVVASMGYITLTTANDQMDRVTWALGVPLWERWVREEERAALDRVAGKWGFQSVDKRGEEEGEEWEALKEFIGLRGMVLDRASLMPGME
jgi:hypothetical protein